MSKGLNLRGSFYLETAAQPTVCKPDVNSAGEPFVFVQLDRSLSVWTHDPWTLRRVAEALVLAADQLEDVALKVAAVRDA